MTECNQSSFGFEARGSREIVARFDGGTISSDGGALPAEIPVEVTEPIKVADEPVIAQLRQAPIIAIQPTGKEVEVAQVVTPPPPEALVAAAKLPATASPLPLMGLLGLLALGGGFALRAVEKRVV